MKTGGTDRRKAHWLTWIRCNAGWWDAMRGNRYAGWSVAQQCRVRWVKNCPDQYACDWFAFNDATNQMIGPFRTPEAAKRSCPLVA
jgi:hypothetical protein